MFQRSFRKELFDDAALRMERALIKTPLELEKFRGLSEKAAEIVVQNMKREVDFSDAPEEFRGDLLISINKYRQLLLQECFYNTLMGL